MGSTWFLLSFAPVFISTRNIQLARQALSISFSPIACYLQLNHATNDIAHLHHSMAANVLFHWLVAGLLAEDFLLEKNQRV
jgi:hypothetical protein